MGEVLASAYLGNKVTSCVATITITVCDLGIDASLNGALRGMDVVLAIDALMKIEAELLGMVPMM